MKDWKEASIVRLEEAKKEIKGVADKYELTEGELHSSVNELEGC